MQLPPSLSPDRFLERLDYHRATENDDLDAYARRHKVQLAQQLEGVQTIYLDTNYWLWLRDTCIGRSRGSVYDQIYTQLDRLVGDSAAICPISAYTWFELDRQADLRTRAATAELIDRFSRGVGIESPDQRAGIEVLHFMQSLITPGAELHPPKALIWTKAAYLLGNTDPWSSAFTPKEMLAFQKAWFDMFWKLPLTDIITELGASPSNKHVWENVAREQTQGKKDHPVSGRPFKGVLMDEIGGVLDASAHILDNVTEYLFLVTMGIEPNEDDIRSIRTEKPVGNTIYQAFRSDRITTQLPFFRVMASLHAAVRLDASRRFKANDQYDFGHAAAALPYCDAFFTEKPLRHLIVTPPVALHDVYETAVISDPEEALAYLAQ